MLGRRTHRSGDVAARQTPPPAGSAVHGKNPRTIVSSRLPHIAAVRGSAIVLISLMIRREEPGVAGVSL
jgi:hypothetical protein